MRATFLLALLAIPLRPAVAQVADSLPPGVTPAMIERGKLLYEGPGFCASCHGADAKGLANAGSNLTDTVWAHSDGSYESIAAQILAGVPAAHASSNIRMPERGASRLTDSQVRAIAAYVWTLSRRPAKPAGG
jgi:mono/diheme cytochrome c family protein